MEVVGLLESGDELLLVLEEGLVFGLELGDGLVYVFREVGDCFLVGEVF